MCPPGPASSSSWPSCSACGAAAWWARARQSRPRQRRQCRRGLTPRPARRSARAFPAGTPSRFTNTIEPSLIGASEVRRAFLSATLNQAALAPRCCRLPRWGLLGDFWGTGPRISEHYRAGAIGTDDHQPLMNQWVAKGGTTTNQGVVGSNPASRASQINGLRAKAGSPFCLLRDFLRDFRRPHPLTTRRSVVRSRVSRTLLAASTSRAINVGSPNSL